MQEILRNLSTGARVLDLGCQYGSFPLQATQATVVRLDRDAPASPPGALYVQADAARLPFATHSFDAVIANHSLEHFDQLGDVLRDLGRILRPGGALFVSVPDASTLTDKIYRWVGKGGGHVNAFTNGAALAQVIERATGLPAVSRRTLYSGLSFLNRRGAPRPLPRRLWLLGGGYEPSLFLYVFLSRRIDRLFHTRSAIYGWALTFGNMPPSAEGAWQNVCIRCGSGAAARELSPRRNFIGFDVYTCRHCGATNPLCHDDAFMPDC
jgi:SAM-dependent methyltransferase